MKRILLVCSLTALVAFVAGCAPSLNNELLKQDGRQLSSAKPLVPPETVEDLRRIPQDVRIFAAAVRPQSSADEQVGAMKRFYERYFSPWTATEPIYRISQAIEDMKGVTQSTWYGPNRLKVEPARIANLLSLAALDRFPSLKQLGIIIAPTFMRALPTSRPLYEASDDFPFDQLQYTEIKPNEPVQILHTSTDDAWLYVETSYASGWVEYGAVRLADDSLRQRLITSQQVVVVMDFAVIRDEQGKPLPQPKIGTLYPLVKEEADYWLVNAAVAGEGENAALKRARIAKKDARRHPLQLTSETVTNIGSEHMKTGYGWGELFRDRDCSATTRDFFLPFGIWLPRNSLHQINSGNAIKLSGLTPSEKEMLILQKGMPFQTLLYLKGHIMLYAGQFEGKPIVLHNTWSVKYRGENSKMERVYIGRTVLTGLELGKELPLINGTLLDKLDGMLDLLQSR